MGQWMRGKYLFNYKCKFELLERMRGPLKCSDKHSNKWALFKKIIFQVIKNRFNFITRLCVQYFSSGKHWVMNFYKISIGCTKELCGHSKLKVVTQVWDLWLNGNFT